MYFSVIKHFILFISALFGGLFFVFSAHGQSTDLSVKDRDEIRSRAIGLVKDYEQMLNVLATKGTTPSDVQDIVNQATQEDGRMFWDNKVNIEDDIYSLKADSGSPKDASIQKYLNDWDLFYTKDYEESVRFLDLRLSDFYQKDYRYLKVFFVSQFKNKHKDFDQIYPLHKRIALIRFEKKGDQWQAWINGISFYTGRKADGSEISQASFEDEYKPFVKEKKARIISGSLVDSTLTESQIQLQKQNDSLYAAAVKANLQKSEDQMRKDTLYTRFVNRADSLLSAKLFPAALEAYTEARAAKPFESYPRARINELTKLLAGGTADPKQLFDKQIAEGERLLKLRDYEGARQSFQSAQNLLPEDAAVKDKIQKTDAIIRNKAEIKSKYTAGNFKLALKDYARVISDNKTNPDYYFERAKCYQAMADNKKALADLNKAVELDQNFSDALSMRALIYQKLGDFPKSISDYATLISIDPKNGEYHYRKGQNLVSSNDLEAAIAEFDQAIQINPKDAQSIAAKADAFRRQGKPDLALIAADKATEANPNYSGGLFQKGLAYLEKGEDEKAASTLLKATKVGLSVDQEKQLESIHDQFFAKARQAATKGDNAEAIAQVNRALTANPKSTESYYFLATEVEKQGKLNDALKALDQAIFMKDDYFPAYLKKGKILVRQADFENALAPLYKAKKLDKKNIEASLGLGDAFTALQQYDSAMVWYGDALHFKPDDADALVKRGKCHFKMENFRRALMDFESAISYHRKNAEAYFFKGRINKELKQPDKAIDDFNEALDLGYNKYECALEVGASYADLGKFGKAIQYFTDAIKMEPNKGEAYARRGQAFLADDNYKEALADLDEALKIDTSLGKAKNRIALGFLKLRFNDYEAAERHFNKALDFDAYSPQANYGLASAQFLIGKKELSLRHFEQAFIPRKLEYDKIKRDPWMKTIVKDSDFKRIQKAYFK